MRVEEYFQCPIPRRHEEASAYRIFLEDFGRWWSTKAGPRPFEEFAPYYIQIGYDALFVQGARPDLVPDDFGKELKRLRAATCATAMIDQDMHQLFSWKQLYVRYRNRFPFPKLENNQPPIDFIDEAVLENEFLVQHMKCLYLLVFRWLEDQSRRGDELVCRLYRQLRADNADHVGLRGFLWTRVFEDVR